MIHTGIFGVNTYIVPISEKQVFVVDPAACEVSGDQDKIINYLEQNNLTCEAVLLTHCHFDHITGILPIVEKFPNAKIAASEIDAREIGFGHVNEEYGTSVAGRNFTKAAKAEFISSRRR
mgnify:CR=1 FL=1